MRARLALAYAGQGYELREVNLKSKPDEMLEVSPKGTVPVMVLANGQVIDESLDIVKWAHENDSKNALAALRPDDQMSARGMIDRFMTAYVPNLNRYKYPDRYELGAGDDPLGVIESMLDDYNHELGKSDHIFFFRGEKPSWLDIALFPLIRQTRVVDEEYFDQMNRPHLLAWFNSFMLHPLFEKIMERYEPWEGGEGVQVHF